MVWYILLRLISDVQEQSYRFSISTVISERNVGFNTLLTHVACTISALWELAAIKLSPKSYKY